MTYAYQPRPVAMLIDSAEYIKLLIALIAIVDIPGNIPMFVQQTAQFNGKQKLITAVVAAVATCAILLSFAFLGEAILSIFGITIAAFKILGGIVVFLIALELLGFLGGEETQVDHSGSDNGPVAVGVFPLAVPLFAGPGAITAVLVYSHEEFHSNHDVIVTLVILSTAIILGVSLVLAGILGRFITPLANIIMNRILGMIVGALGVEFVLEGIAEFFQI